MEINIIMHTHWDREWYFSHLKSRVYSLNTFDEIIRVMEENQNINSFLMDGQTSIIEEYLAMHPNMEERLKKLIKNKRIFTGPWFSQTDTLIISAENIVRNLLYGTNYAKRMGHSMEIGYLPDSFGMSEQMPQFYNGFDMKYAMFRRGISDDMTKDREFYWESIDGSKIFTHNIYHYGSMAYPPEDEKGIKDFIKDRISLLSSNSKTGIIVLFNGEDQKPIRKNIVDIVSKMNKVMPDVKTVLISPEELMKKLENSEYNFSTQKGEMTSGQHSRSHKSIFSTRADLKSKNNRLDNFLINILEPVLSISHILGFNYEKNSMDYLWKKMLENSAHDSIGNCNSDSTNRFIEQRYNEVEEYGRNLLEMKLRQISMNIDCDNIFNFQIYNLLPYRRGGFITIDVFLPGDNVKIVDSDNNEYDFIINTIKDVTDRIYKLSVRETGVGGNINPLWLTEKKNIFLANITIRLEDILPFGYTTFSVVEKENGKFLSDAHGNNQLLSSRNDVYYDNHHEEFFEIKNQFYDIYVKNGIINCLDKKSGKLYKNFISIEEDGDEGDSYNYSTPTCNRIYSKIEKLKIQKVENRFYSKLIVQGIIKIPSTPEQRQKDITDSNINVKLNICLNKEDDVIELKSDILNKDSFHRVRLIVKTGIESEHSVADQQFGTIYRNTTIDLHNWKERGFNEKPITVEPMMSYCALRNNNSTVQVITKNVKEYQAIGDKLDSLALTLYRANSYLGRENLNDRPGRESGNKSETYDTRFTNKTIKSTHFIKIYDKCASDYELAYLSREIRTPFIMYQGSEFKNNTDFLLMSVPKEKRLPQKLSLFEVEGDYILSTFKKAEIGDDIIIRIFNAEREKCIDGNIHLYDLLKGKHISEVKMNEETIVKKEITTIEAKPNQAKTFRVCLSR